MFEIASKMASRLERAGFSYQTQKLASATRDDAGMGRGYHALPLPLSEGGILRGFVRRPDRAEARWLLFFPGNARGQLAEALDIVELLRAGRDLGVAVWSYRGFEGSSGLPSPDAAIGDAHAQRAFLDARLGVTPDKLVLAGYSMGSGIALRLAANLSEQGQQARGLLLLSPFSSLTLKPANLAGSRDAALPIDQHAKPLARTLGEKARYIELPGKDHTDYLVDPVSLAPAVDFIASC